MRHRRWEGEGEWVDDLGTQGLHPALYYAAPTGLRRAKMPPMRARAARMCRICICLLLVLVITVVLQSYLFRARYATVPPFFPFFYHIIGTK